MKNELLKLFEQANHIWDTSYNEYRKIGYRLRKEGYCEQTSIFDFIGEN